MVTFEHVTKKFPRRDGELNLRDITLTIGNGETAGLLGPGGAGKMELLKLILGTAEPDSGRIWVMGKYPGFAVKHPAGMSRADRNDLGFMLKRTADAGETVENYLSVRFKKLKPDYREFMDSVARRLQIEGLQKSHLRFLSNGERTRVDFYKAVLNQPRLLLLYEPDIGLDALMKEAVYAVIGELNERFGVTVVVATQSLAVAEKLCGQVFVLDQGRLVYSGGCGTLRKSCAAVNQIRMVLQSGFPDLQDLPVKRFSARGNRFEAEYDETEITGMEIIKRVFATCEVKQVEISEPDTDAVIRNIYQNGGKGDGL